MIKTFKQFITEKTQKAFTGTSGCYCSMLLSNNSVTAMSDLCKANGAPFTQKDEIHCTVIYSPDNVPEHIPTPKGMPFFGHVVGFDLFGPDKDCLVGLVQCQWLNDLHNEFVSAGAVPTYPEYRPHITLAKVEPGTHAEFVGKSISPVPVEFVSMTIEDIDKD